MRIGVAGAVIGVMLGTTAVPAAGAPIVSGRFDLYIAWVVSEFSPFAEMEISFETSFDPSADAASLPVSNATYTDWFGRSFVPVNPVYSYSSAFDRITLTAAFPTVSVANYGPTSDAVITLLDVSTAAPRFESAVATLTGGPNVGRTSSPKYGILTFTPIALAVPEPASIALLAAGLAALVPLARRRGSRPTADDGAAQRVPASAC